MKFIIAAKWMTKSLLISGSILVTGLWILTKSDNLDLNYLPTLFESVRNTTINIAVQTIPSSPTTKQINEIDDQNIPLSSTSIERTVQFSQIQYSYNTPWMCTKSPSLHLIAVIISLPEHFHRRQVLRNTWTKPLSLSNNTSVVFLTGRSKSESVHAQVIIEANKTKDLIVMNFDESYKNLSVKTLLMLRWVKDHCPNAKFLLKADDDMFINIYNLLDFINSEQPNNSAIYGKFAHNWPPIRNSDSKWMVTLQEYDKPTYPDFVAGPSYLFGTKHIGQLLAVCIRLPYLYLEDVFVTGICAEESRIARKHHSGFVNMPLPTGRCSILQIISVHRVYGRSMKNLWESVSNLNLYESCKIKKPTNV